MAIQCLQSFNTRNTRKVNVCVPRAFATSQTGFGWRSVPCMHSNVWRDPIVLPALRVGVGRAESARETGGALWSPGTMSELGAPELHGGDGRIAYPTLALYTPSGCVTQCRLDAVSHRRRLGCLESGQISRSPPGPSRDVDPRVTYTVCRVQSFLEF